MMAVIDLITANGKMACTMFENLSEIFSCACCVCLFPCWLMLALLTAVAQRE